MLYMLYNMYVAKKLLFYLKAHLPFDWFFIWGFQRSMANQAGLLAFQARQHETWVISSAHPCPIQYAFPVWCYLWFCGYHYVTYMNACTCIIYSYRQVRVVAGVIGSSIAMSPAETHMITPWHGNAFRTTGPFVRETHRWPPLIARFMGPTWGPSGADRTQVGPMLAPWTVQSGSLRASNAELWCFIMLSKGWTNSRVTGEMRHHVAHVGPLYWIWIYIYKCTDRYRRN